MAISIFDRVRDRDANHSCAPDGQRTCVRVVATAALPTRFGRFQAIAFTNPVDDGKEHAAFMHGERAIDGEDVPVRIHSECLTGDAIGSLRCDCRDQLEASLRQLAKMPYGVLLYLRQEGRGIGLTNKIRAYELQDHGLDTVDANRALGFRDDERDYGVAAHMLRSLGIRSVKLLTNNPRKIEALDALGIRVTERIPLVIPPNQYDRRYLTTKAHRSGHLIDDVLLEQAEEPVVAPSTNGRRPVEATGGAR
ncbi:MAG: GTP cyclohydrolase II [Chloroflexota bacterium]|jgi:GTP cyclohydrolase II